MAGMRSWEETLRRVVETDAFSDTLLALEQWLHVRAGYAVTFGKVERSDGSRVWAVALTMPKRGTVQFSSELGMNDALTLAMLHATKIEAREAEQRAVHSDQLKPSAAASVAELLRNLHTTPWSGGSPTT